MPISETGLAAAAAELQSAKLIAPVLHTITVVVIIVLVFGVGFTAVLAGASPAGNIFGSRRNIMVLYGAMIVVEWGLVYYIWHFGIRHSGLSLRGLIGGRWSTPIDVVRDVAIAVAILYASGQLDHAFIAILRPEPVTSLDVLLPSTALELTFWLFVSFTAGICEEVIFRAYLQRQFTAITHSAIAGILLQAMLFGAGHAYQGTNAVLIAAEAVLLGVIAHWRKSLRPGMIAHIGSDFIAGALR